MKNKYVKVGSYCSETTDCKECIEKAAYGQGYIFKDEEAFQSGSGVCYIPELSDSKYTKRDLLELCDNDVDIATELFSTLDWQHPETLIEDWFVNGELDKCNVCGKMMECYGINACPHCGAAYENDDM